MFDPDRRHLIAYVAAAAVLVVIAARLLGREGAEQPSVSLAAPQPAGRVEAAARPRAVKRIWVDVAGAVRAPGLYSLAEGARVAAAIGRAGGVTRRADRSAVNLAAKLVDGQQVFVPARIGGAGPTGRGSMGAGSAGAGSGGAGSRGAGSMGPGSAAGASSAAGATGGGASAPISLSAASPEQLEQLDGIGPALAARIIEYREQNGGFRSIDQLREVSGIGDKRFEALKDSIAP